MSGDELSTGDGALGVARGREIGLDWDCETGARVMAIVRGVAAGVEQAALSGGAPAIAPGVGL